MRYFVLSFLCLIAVISYVQRTGINSVSDRVQFDLDINTEQFGALGAAWLLGYALLQVPAGWLADRIGARTALVGYALAWSTLTAGVGLCRSFESMLVVWCLMGMAVAGVFPCAAKSIGAWFPATETATASGLLGSLTLLGAALANTLTPWLLRERQWSWQLAYVAYGLAGIAWALAYAALVPERRHAHGLTPALAPALGLGDWRRLAGSVSMWLICGQQFFRAGAMIFFLNWFPKFLQESRRLSDVQAGRYASAALIAAMIGGILGGFCSDGLLRLTGWRRLSRQGIAVAGMSACSGLILATSAIAADELAIAVFSLGAFIAAFGGVSGYTVTIEFGGKHVATVFSLMNMSGNFGAAIAQYLAGSLKEHTGSWNTALFMFAGIFALDAVCWALLNPPGPLFEEHDEAR
jgi:nitrate/nitrite transporter NarK